MLYSLLLSFLGFPFSLLSMPRSLMGHLLGSMLGRWLGSLPCCLLRSLLSHLSSFLSSFLRCLQASFPGCHREPLSCLMAARANSSQRLLNSLSLWPFTLT